MVYHFICNGWAINIIKQDNDYFLSRFINEKKVVLPWLDNDTLLEPQFTVPPFTTPPSTSTTFVLSNPQYLEMIFSKLDDATDKETMCCVCKQWAKLFYTKQWQYDRTLQTRTSYGRCIVSRGGLIVSKRCLCYTTKNIVAKALVHILQYIYCPDYDEDEELVFDHLVVADGPHDPPMSTIPQKRVDRASNIAHYIVYPPTEVVNVD